MLIIQSPESTISRQGVFYIPAPRVVASEAVLSEYASAAATNDRDSWHAHSVAQLAMGEPEYIPYYSKFIANRTTVESVQFGITTPASNIVATWLGRSAMYHDDAEKAQDTNDVATGRVQWGNVHKALITRYLCLSIARTLTDAEFCELFQGIDLLQIDPDQMTALLRERIGNGLDNTFDQRLELAQTQARFELAQWKTHHDRDYQGFGKATVALLVSLGYQENVAIAAAPYLAAACQRHDHAEELGVQDADGNAAEIQQCWEDAKTILVSYYGTLLSPNN